jgi:hypothetical protein
MKGKFEILENLVSSSEAAVLIAELDGVPLLQ